MESYLYHFENEQIRINHYMKKSCTYLILKKRGLMKISLMFCHAAIYSKLSNSAIWPWSENSRSIKINFLDNQYTSFYIISTMLTKALFWKIMKLFGIKKWWKSLYFFKTLPVLLKLKSFKIKVYYELSPICFYILSNFLDIVRSILDV